MGCRQCLLPVQLKGKDCWKSHCHNGVVDTFGHIIFWKIQGRQLPCLPYLPWRPCLMRWVAGNFNSRLFNQELLHTESVMVKKSGVELKNKLTGLLRAEQDRAKQCCQMGWFGYAVLEVSKKTIWDFNFLFIFVIPSSRIHEKCCSVLCQSDFFSINSPKIWH